MVRLMCPPASGESAMLETTKPPGEAARDGQRCDAITGKPPSSAATTSSSCASRVLSPAWWHGRTERPRGQRSAALMLLLYKNVTPELLRENVTPIWRHSR